MNNQQLSKIINFYRINHHFHDPYRLLLDGNFLKLLVEKQIDFKRRLQNVINGKVSPRITACILRELELLGQEFKFVVEEARKWQMISCKHAHGYSVDQCIVDQIGQSNEHMYTVCTQDIQLRRYLREMENVPLMYFGPDQRITMEDVQRKNLRNLQLQIKKKFMPNQNQLPQIEKYKNEEQNEQKLRKKQELKKIASFQGIKIKTKIAKGPNPLSVKKKKIKGNTNLTQTKTHSQKDHKQQQIQNTQQQLPHLQKKKRIRKRNKKPTSSN